MVLTLEVLPPRQTHDGWSPYILEMRMWSLKGIRYLLAITCLTISSLSRVWNECSIRTDWNAGEEESVAVDGTLVKAVAYPSK